MSTAMSTPQREAFLAALHVGTVSVTSIDGDRAPLAVPIWYDYAPATGVRIITSRSSRKGAAIERAQRFTLVAQDESTPYRYVSVEGPVVETRRCEVDRDLLPIAVRYLGVEAGTAYAEQWQMADNGEDHVYVMRPEHWHSADLTPMFAALDQTAVSVPSPPPGPAQQGAS